MRHCGKLIQFTRPSVRVHWVACGTCSVPGNFFQVGVCSRYNARSDWLIVTAPRADYGLAKTKQKVIKKPYNKLLTNRTSSSRTGEYQPWVVFVLPRPRANISLAVRPSRSVSKKLLRGHPEVIPAEALWLTGPHTFVRRNRSFSEVKNLATGLISSFSYFPNREKTAVNQPSPKNVFFSQKIFKVRGKKYIILKLRK